MMISNPRKCLWTLQKPKFYADLYGILQTKRIPLEMIYRAIDTEVCQKTTGNKDAYFYVRRNIILIYQSSEIKESGESTEEFSQENDLDKENTSDDISRFFLKHNVEKREKRAQ